MKERVVDDHYDPVRWLIKKVAGGGPKKKKANLPMYPQDVLTETSAATPTAKHKDGEQGKAED